MFKTGTICYLSDVFSKTALEKTSSVFQGPPKMLELATEWVSKTYASHILALALSRKQRMFPSSDVKIVAQKVTKFKEKNLKNLTEKLIKKFNEETEAKGFLDRNAPYARLDFSTDNYKLKVGIKYNRDYYGGISKGAGRIKYEYIGPMYEDVEEYFDKLATKLTIAGQSLNDDKMKYSAASEAIDRLIEECEKFTDTPKYYKASASTKIPIDFSGWEVFRDKHVQMVNEKYIDEFNRIVLSYAEKAKRGFGYHDYFQKFEDPDVFVKLYKHPEMDPLSFLESHIKSTEELEKIARHVGFKNLELSLNFNTRKTIAGTARFNSIKVDAIPLYVYDRLDFISNLNKMKKTVRHEVAHFGQFVMRQMIDSSFGVLSKKLLDTVDQGKIRKSKMDSTKKEFLKPMEFYTYLGDAIQEYEIYRNYGHKNEEDVNDFIRKYVGIEEPAPWKTNGTNFFRTLKANAPELWKKAVKEFFKAIQETNKKNRANPQEL